MGASKARSVPGRGGDQERFNLTGSLESDSFIEIDTGLSRRTVDRSLVVDFDFGLSFSSAMSDSYFSTQTPADILFRSGQLLPLQNVTNSPTTVDGELSSSPPLNCDESSTTGMRNTDGELGQREYYFCEDQESLGPVERRRSVKIWNLLNCRRSSSKVCMENDPKGRKPMEKPNFRDPFSTERKPPKNMTGIKKLLAGFRTKELGEARGQQPNSPHQQTWWVNERTKSTKATPRANWIRKMVNPLIFKQEGNKGKLGDVTHEASQERRKDTIAAASFGESYRKNKAHSCPSSFASSPINWRTPFNFSHSSTDFSECPVQAAIDHCKRSINVGDDAGK